jgi:hypothetical protein
MSQSPKKTVLPRTFIGWLSGLLSGEKKADSRPEGSAPENLPEKKTPPAPKQDVFTLEQHEMIEFEGQRISVRRVPGGWLYMQHEYGYGDGGYVSSCFIPYSENKTNKNCSLALGEMKMFDAKTSILRVPGGCMYTYREHGEGSGKTASSFVPDEPEVALPTKSTDT